MSLVSDTIPSLVRGVSQAPSAARLPGKAEILRNASLSILEGHDKRPPSEWVAKLADYSPDPEYDTPFVHWVNRDATTQYAVVVEDGALRVFDLPTGDEMVVNVEGGADAYLACSNARTALGAMTIADTTFIWNRETVVENVATSSAALTNDALVFVRSGAYGREYSITLNGTKYSYRTHNGSQSWHTPFVGADFIAQILVEARAASHPIITNIGPGWHSADQAFVSMTGAGSAAGVTVTRVGSVIRIQSATPFTISTEDGQDGAALTLINGSARRVSDLPRKAWNNYKVRVGKITENSDEDLYLRFDDANNDNEGEWVETLGPSVNLGVDPETMPIQLVLEDNGEFTLKYAAWAAREVGTVDSAPDPVFVGRKIKDMVYYLGRLAILSGEDISFGAAQDLLRFYRLTTREALPDDPFTLTASASKTALLNYAAVLDNTLVVFADTCQLQVQRNAELFTRGGVSLVESAAYAASPNCRPVNLGQTVAFTYANTEHAAFAEYAPVSADRGAVSDDMSADILRYVPADVFAMAASPTHKHLAVLTASQPDKLYVYTWFSAGNQALLSEWNTWEFVGGGDIVGIHFVGPRLYLMQHRAGDGLHLEYVDLSPAKYDEGSTYRTRLDGLVTNADCTFTYNSTLNRTTITTPFSTTGMTLQVVGKPYTGSPVGVLFPVVTNTGNGVVVEGKAVAVPFMLGRPYTWQKRFSTLYVREDGPSQNGAAILDGRLQVADIAVDMVGPCYIKARVQNEQRTPYEKVYSAYAVEPLDDATQQQHKSKPFKFRVAAQNTKAVVDLLNDTFLPNKILGCQWRGNFNPVARQV